MAFRWSTSQTVAEHKNLQASSLAIAYDGTHCALLSRRAITVINLDAPMVIQKKIRRSTKWDTTAAEWSKCDKRLLAVTNAQTVEVYSIDGSDTTVDNTNDMSYSIEKSSPSSVTSVTTPSPASTVNPFIVIKGHTRTVTDLNWSPYDSDLIATAAYDNMVNIWDLRDHRRAQMAMSSVAGASQVKWSKMNEHTLASCHEGDVRVWDKRKSKSPTHYITAHLSKINGLDWNPSVVSQFATCSQDGSVRFWDLNSLKGRADNLLNTNLPVWRGRYTPFGHGLLTALVPQLRRSGENNSLWLWTMDCFLQPLHAFVGHLDVVLEFGWRRSDCDDDDYELVTWSKDNSLRIWKVDAKLLKDDNYDNPLDFDFNSEEVIDVNGVTKMISDDFAKLSVENDTDLSINNPQRPLTLNLNQNHVQTSKSPEVLTPQMAETPNLTQLSLYDEFSQINESLSIPNIRIEELNPNKRFCIFTATTTITCRIKMTFPMGYPNQESPHFNFLNGTTALTEEIKKELTKVLQTTAFLQVKRNRICLEPCLRQLIGTLERLTGTASASTPTLVELFPAHHYGSYLDASVPFPRTSGARFCASDILVCFGRPPHLEQINAPMELTPRSLSALSGYLLTHYRTTNVNVVTNVNSNVSAPEMPSISSFYFNKSKRRHQNRSRGHHLTDGGKSSTKSKHSSPNCGPVFVFRCHGLLPISRNLAEMYVFNTDGDAVKMCETNAKISAAFGRKDLCHKWNLIKLSAEVYQKSIKDNDELPWAVHPFGRKLVYSLVEHSVKMCGDIQTAAMFACAFDTPECRKHNSLNRYKQQSLQSHGNSINGNTTNLTGNYPYHTVGPTPAITDNSEEWNMISSPYDALKRTRSNSWSEFPDDMLIINTAQNDMSHDHGEMEMHKNNLKMLDPKMQQQYDWYKQIYADILFRWQMLEERAHVLKCTSSSASSPITNNSVVHHCGIDFVTECHNPQCDQKSVVCYSPQCQRCLKPTLFCAVCRLQVTGAAIHCVHCCHGGHTLHMQQWFSLYEFCPSGCGCQCLSQPNFFS